MTPYYEHGGITIYHGDCRDVLPTLADESADLVLTDPPYAEETHDGARTASRVQYDYERKVPGKLVNFAPISEEELRGTFVEVGRIARAWVVSTMDWRHIYHFEKAPPAGLRFVRFGIWVKPNGAPQFTGDRPGTGWEGIIFLHREGGKMRWGGGGRHGVFTHNIANQFDRLGSHPTAKPVPLMAEFIRLFSESGQMVLDPFMGCGTTLYAAKLLHRRAIGIEQDEKWCEVAALRLSQEVLPLAI